MAPSAAMTASTRPRTAASASGCAYIARPTRTARPAARSAAEVVGIEVGGVGRLVAGRAQALLERERGVRQRRAVRRGGGAGAGGGSGSGSGSPRRRRSRRASASARRPWRRAARVEHDAAAEGVGRGDRAHDDAVAGAGEQRLLQPRLPQPAAEVGQARGRLARAVVHVRAHAVARVAQRELAVEHPRRRHRARVRRRRRRARRRARSTPARLSATRWPAPRALDGLVVDLHRRAPAPACPPGAATRRSPGATAPDHSVPVTTVPAPRMVKARSTCSSGSPARAPRPGRRGGDRVEGRAHLARRRRRVRAEHGTTTALREQLGHLALRARRVGEVGLGHRDDAVAHAERGEHRGVLERLGHHAVVGGDDHQVEVDPRRARRPSCARSARGPARRRPTAGAPTAGRAARSRARSRCRAPSRGQAVGVHAGQRGDERRLAVVDVAGGAEGERASCLARGAHARRPPARPPRR